MASYTVVIAPLRNNPTCLDALRFFLWVKKLKYFEQERDVLWTGLQALETLLESFCCYLEENSEVSVDGGNAETEMPSTDTLLAQVSRVNKVLRRLIKPIDPGHLLEGTKGNSSISKASASF